MPPNGVTWESSVLWPCLGSLFHVTCRLSLPEQQTGGLCNGNALLSVSRNRIFMRCQWNCTDVPFNFAISACCVTAAEPPGGFPVNLCWRVVLQAFRYVPVLVKDGHHWRALVNVAQLLTYLSDGKLSANIHINISFTSSPNIALVIKSRIRWAGHVARMGERTGVYRVLVGKPEIKWPLGRPRSRWEDNNKMDLQEVGCGGLDWIELAQDRDRWRTPVNVVMNFRGP